MRILAVDDDAIILELLTELLATFGQHHVEIALSGAEALERVAARAPGHFDCILLDIQMPEMDGVALCGRLRGCAGYDRTPVLMITAMSDKGHIDRAFAAGATDYVTKPFDIAELRARIETVQHRLTRDGAPGGTVFAIARSLTAPAERVKVALNEPVTILDVDGVIGYFAFENYVTQLSRGALFGSTVFAFAIRDIEQLYLDSTAFGFECLVTDTAEAISDCLKPTQFLISYAGNGTFVCVTEGGFRPDTDRLTDAVNLRLREMDLYYCNGRKLEFRVCTGESLRLVWRAGTSALQAVIHAHASAEKEAERRERASNDFWLKEHAI